MWKVAFSLLGSLPLAVCLAQAPASFVEAGNAKYAAKDFDGAIADYSKALSANPKNASAFKLRGRAKSMKGDWKGCVSDLNAALAIEPKNQEFLATRAFSYLHLGNFTNANADFATMQRLDPSNGPKAKFEIAQGLLERARSKSAKHDNEGAVKDLDMVLAVAPRLGVAYHERGAAKLDLKRYKEAVADFDLALKDAAWHNKYGDSFILRAKAKRALGDAAGAAADEREAAKKSRK
jgi:tetratricopeptide (TPR) repeat protein